VQKKTKRTTVSMVIDSLFASRSLKQNEAAEGDGVSKHLKGSDLGPKHKHGAGNQQDILGKQLGVEEGGNWLD
jgi:hypothetical protein